MRQSHKSTVSLMVTSCMALSLVSAPATAQSMAGIQAQMNSFNARLAANQQRINGMIQQRMNDPQVRAAYSRYVARTRANGQWPISYQKFTYQYVATNGFSSRGTALYRHNEAINQSKIANSVAGLRQAEANRGAAQTNMQDHYNNNQYQTGLLLRGQSTYYGPNGGSTELPHTWQANSNHRYQGNVYHVDASGNYYVATANGLVPLHQ